MRQSLIKHYNKGLTIVLMLSCLLISVGSYSDNTQHKTNGLYANSGNGHVIVTKNGYHKNGTILEEGIEGVAFKLYKVTSSGNIQLGSTITTDIDGKLLLSGLEIGDYYLEELALPQGYEFEKDEAGNSINKFPFRIDNDDMDAPIILEIKNIKAEGAFTISKEVVNADGSNLEESQKQEVFKFKVLFGKKVDDSDYLDDKQYSYSVNGGNSISISNGDTIELKTGETAIFEYLQPNTKYKVVELEHEGYYVSSHNNEGVFIDNSNVKFINTVISESKGTIVIHKEVDAYEGVDLPLQAYDKKFEFQILFDSDKSYPAKIAGENIFDVKSGDSIYLQHGQSITLFDLPYGMSYTVKESNYVDEGYVAESQIIEGNIGSNSLPLHHYFNNIYFGFDNTPEQDVVFSVSKEVLNASDLSASFEFFVNFDTEKDIKFQIDGGTIANHENNSPIYISHGQSIKFIDVPIGTKYTVKESPSEGFETLINLVDGTVAQDEIIVTIKNFKIDENMKDTTISVTKTVIGKVTDKQFDFELTLGDRVEKFKLSHGETKLFNVPIGTQYKIIEIDYHNEGFTQSISNGSGVTKEHDDVVIDVINTYDFRNEKVNIAGEKKWDVGDYGHNYIPNSISLDILANGIFVKNIEVIPNESGEWTYEVLMPKYTLDKDEIQYTINERSITNFEGKVEGLNITNTLTLPANYEINVTKKLMGDNLDREVDFFFSLESLGNAPINDKSLVKITNEGSTSFSTLTFESEGTFKYLVKEIDSNEEGISYDDKPVIVTVKVIRDSYQLIIDSVEYMKLDGSKDQSAVFTNIYKKIVLPENPEEPNETEKPNNPENPIDKPTKPEKPNGSGGGAPIGDLPHTGVQNSKAVILGTFSILTGMFLILCKEDRKIKEYLNKEVRSNEEK